MPTSVRDRQSFHRGLEPRRGVGDGGQRALTRTCVEREGGTPHVSWVLSKTPCSLPRPAPPALRLLRLDPDPRQTPHLYILGPLDWPTDPAHLGLVVTRYHESSRFLGRVERPDPGRQGLWCRRRYAVVDGQLPSQPRRLVSTSKLVVFRVPRRVPP